MSEFYIKPEYRKKGIGKKAAISIFEMLPGNWEICQLTGNTPAHTFWLDVIGTVTGGKYSETIVNNEQFHGYVQTFHFG